MGVWDWVFEFNVKAENQGDRPRARLLQLYDSAAHYDQSNPDVMLGLLAEGRALAQQLNEPWWVLFFDHWRLQALMHYKYDFREVRGLAVQATLEARKPQYAQLPQRLCLHEDLIFAYIGTDPEGHAEQIQQALDYMRQEVSSDLECRFCVQNCRSEFAMQRGKLDEAEAACLQLLAMTDAEKERHTAEHHALDAYSDLCAIAFARGNWQALREWSTLGDELARRLEEPLELAEHLAWRALLEARDGRRERAQRLYRQAVAKVARLKALPSGYYFDALCAYQEQAGDRESALGVRRQELRALAGKGRFAHEVRCRVHCCRLLAQLAQPLEADLAAAREVAGKLRFPQKYLEELDRIAKGS